MDRPSSGHEALSAATTVVGVIGDPVDHSRFPLLHNAAFAALGLDWVSVGFPAPADAGRAALVGAHALGVRGLSVTMPHKELAAQVAVSCSPLAERLGAVNCLVAEADGWRGENTDGAGLVAALRRGAAFDPDGRRCAVVGAGGAARAVIAALADAGAGSVVVINRTQARAERAAALAGPVGSVGDEASAEDAELVVNATPLGMGATGDGEDRWPVDPDRLGPGQVVVDLVYAPAVTPWLAAASARGCATHNGLGMLVHQAALQVELWTGATAPVAAMWEAVSGELDDGGR